jgi:hypothetical protein
MLEARGALALDVRPDHTTGLVVAVPWGWPWLRVALAPEVALEMARLFQGGRRSHSWPEAAMTPKLMKVAAGEYRGEPKCRAFTLRKEVHHDRHGIARTAWIAGTRIARCATSGGAMQSRPSAAGWTWTAFARRSSMPCCTGGPGRSRNSAGA